MTQMANRDPLWRAAAAVCNANLGNHAEAQGEVLSLQHLLESLPQSPLSSACAALLAEAAYALKSPKAAEAAARILSPRSGEAIVLKAGAVHLGPVDRYLGLCFAANEGDAATALVEAAIEQSSRSGITRWSDRAHRDLVEINQLSDA